MKTPNDFGARKNLTQWSKGHGHFSFFSFFSIFFAVELSLNH